MSDKVELGSAEWKAHHPYTSLKRQYERASSKAFWWRDAVDSYDVKDDPMFRVMCEQAFIDPDDPYGDGTFE